MTFVTIPRAHLTLRTINRVLGWLGLVLVVSTGETEQTRFFIMRKSRFPRST